jgi:dienelactone hydrolase
MESNGKSVNPRLVLLLLLLLPVLAHASEGSSGAPIEAFARTPHVVGVTLSPDRRFLVYLTSEGDVRSVVVHDRLSKEPTRTVWSSEGSKELDVQWCGWANATRFLCSAVFTVGRASVVNPAFFRATRLFAFDYDGGRPKVLMQGENERRTLYQDEVLDWTPEDPDTVLVQLRKDLTDHQAVYKLNVYTSALEEQTRLRRFAAYYSDGAGEARLARKDNESASSTYYVRRAGDEKWKRWAVLDYLERIEHVEPWRVLPKSNRLIGVRHHFDRLALWETDFELEGKHAPKLLFGSPRFDVDDVQIAPGGQLLGVSYHDDRPRMHYFDARARSVIESADRFLPDAYNSIFEMTPDHSAYLVHSASDVEAGTFHLLDLGSETTELVQIGESYPELRNHELGRMQPIEYPARDGTKIPGYLTVPPGSKNRQYPLILMPHDGPMDRTVWKFDYLRSFLVDRGYAVLEMNYRGSTGYGWRWQHAGYRQWGGLTYNDILDAAHWAIDQGIAARDQICIAGRGFGGYQALLGAARDSSIYRCAISIGAWTSLLDAREYAERWMDSALTVKEIGRSPTTLLAQSPIRHVDKIDIPVLLVHAERDWLVPATQSRSMALQLRRYCTPHKLVIIPDADRDLRWQSDRMVLLSAIEEFLTANLKGEREDPEPTCRRLSR